MKSAWFARAGPADGGFLIPGRPRMYAASLLLADEHVLVTAVEREGWVPRAQLEWADYHGRWWIVRGETDSTVGVSLFLRRELVTQTKPLRDTLPHSWERRGRARSVRTAWVPLQRRTGLVEHETATLSALCQLLVTRPETRGHLAEPDRMRWLARDMSEAPLRALALPEAPQTARIVTEMRALGYTHPVLGRPMPDDELVRPEDAVEHIVECLRTEQPTARLGAVAQQAARLVAKYYFGVERWPFAALVM